MSSSYLILRIIREVFWRLLFYRNKLIQGYKSSIRIVWLEMKWKHEVYHLSNRPSISVPTQRVLHPLPLLSLVQWHRVAFDEDIWWRVRVCVCLCPYVRDAVGLSVTFCGQQQCAAQTADRIAAPAAIYLQRAWSNRSRAHPCILLAGENKYAHAHNVPICSSHTPFGGEIRTHSESSVYFSLCTKCVCTKRLRRNCKRQRKGT